MTSTKYILQSIELHDVKLQLLGDHQRQNAVTAACAALCLRQLGNEACQFILFGDGPCQSVWSFYLNLTVLLLFYETAILED